MSFCTQCNSYLGSRQPWSFPAEISASNTIKPRTRKYKKYRYDRLSKNRGIIRVLRLLGNGSKDAEVECELVAIEFVKDKPLEYEYEALSWCWGTSNHTGRIVIRKGGKDPKDIERLSKRVTPDLVAALKALRYQGKDRYLWIDQVCVDQDYTYEKNHQVEMMAEIYGRAKKVCVWLGEGDQTSQMALKFIKKEVLQLQNFDELCESELASEKWGALLLLMQRNWFSRRWVVQEIALARSTMVYCGSDKIPWKDFAVAVELFVEVETATHRLSEVMKKDPRFYHVPGWFEYVSELGASLLVEATGKLFRDYKPNGPIESPNDSDSESNPETDVTTDVETASEADTVASDSTAVSKRSVTEFGKHNRGQPLLTLEYLVSSLSIFEVTKSHDAVYALLAIARDTTPLADDEVGYRRQLVSTQGALEEFTQSKRYTVDYDLPFPDVCKEFVTFCIESSNDRTRALDIICRPWAPDVTNNAPKNKKNRKRKVKHNADRDRSREERVPMENQKANSERSNGESTQLHGSSSRISTQSAGDIEPSQAQRERKVIKHPDQVLALPSWIQSLSGAAYAMYSQAGVHTLKMGRKNADTLVGLPSSNQSLERNYKAAESREVDLKSLRFVKRVQMKHWSMYVKGFVLDTVLIAQASSQGGAIPRSWAKAGGWLDAPNSDPPDEFWRTLVADRGRDGKNPPVYYSRACKEAFAKGGLSGGSVNMTDLINNERCSIVAQFCRRVQAVIWNRRLVTTEAHGLGLTGQDVQREDLICILYGCSVPVALRRERKTKESVLEEMKNDLRLFQEQIFAVYKRKYDQLQYRKLVTVCAKYRDFCWYQKWCEVTGRSTLWQDALDQQREKDCEDKGGKSKSVFDLVFPVFALIRFLLHAISMIFGFRAASMKGKNSEQSLERRAYQQWKNEKRKSKEIPEIDFKRWDKRIFELQLRYGRRWRSAVTKKSGAPEAVGTKVRSWLSDLLNRSTKTTADIRDTRDDYVQAYEARYLKAFKNNEDAHLEEPDWKRDDKKSLRIQEKWCYYKFLGECYVHGLMDGEAMFYQNDNEVPAQVFELR